MIDLKSKEELNVIRDGCRLLSELFEELGRWVKEGVSTLDLDRETENWIVKRKAKPAFKGYRGYPASLCVSINDEVVHGIPNRNKRIAARDIVGIDCGLIHNGFYADMAFTYIVGNVSQEVRRLVETTQESLYKGIEMARTGNRLFDISHTIQAYVEERGYSVVREFVGHGIGRQLHEDPQVPNYGQAGKGVPLSDGLVLAIEPMVNAGGHEVRVEPDGWTVRTKDGSLSAHFEHTVAITSNGPEILTRTPK